MVSRYPDAEELARTFRERSSDWLRNQLALGTLTSDAATAAFEELERRGETSSAPVSGGDEESIQDSTSSVRDDVPSTKSTWPWWAWPVTFLGAFVLVACFGVKAHGAENQEFLWWVIFLQAFVLTLAVFGIASFAKARSTSGVIGRLFMLALLAVMLFGLSLCSSLAQTGWGG